MQHDSTPFNPISFAQKIFMTIGAVLFIVLSGSMFMQAGNPQAARNVADPQPELRATAVFSR
ncbi:MAG: hypothetical protein JWP13_290 [Candidatus Saccharibacteria bacterium]|nr:hypothetical protein [Candidatus Saccharibacteria bacterium]